MSLLNMVNDALHYAALGWRVFPCEVGGKRPITPHGFKDATSHAGIVRQWWTDTPDANIGYAIPEDRLIVDLDPRNGAPPRYSEHFRGLPRTLEVATPSGGSHLYFDVAPGQNWVGRWPGVEGVDIKAPGKGYVLLPPSRLARPGEGEYVWASPPALEPAELPPGFVGILARQYRIRKDGDVVVTRARYFPWESGSAYGLKVLAGSLKRLADTHEGRRNSDLFTATRYVAEFIEGGELSDKVLEQVRDAALATGLGIEEVMNTMRAAYEAGAENPRSAS